MLAVLFGLMFVAVGLLGIVVWFPSFVEVMKGTMPLLITVGGFISIVMGVSSIKDSKTSAKTDKKK